jgi:vacuolar iron transporter family protein
LPDVFNCQVIVLGLANLFADAISMGLGDALSEKAEMDMIAREYKRETWEMDSNPAGEVGRSDKLKPAFCSKWPSFFAQIKEMKELYMEQGVSAADANLILTTMAKHKTFFVNHMMVMELGMKAPEEGDNPWINGAVTFCSFVGFGSVPLISYLIFNAAGSNGGVLFGM